jgi:hypothetical protein
VHCKENRLDPKGGTEGEEILRFELLPSSNSAAAARSEFGGFKLDWLGFFFERKIVRGRGLFIENFP